MLAYIQHEEHSYEELRKALQRVAMAKTTTTPTDVAAGLPPSHASSPQKPRRLLRKKKKKKKKAARSADGFEIVGGSDDGSSEDLDTAAITSHDLEDLSLLPDTVRGWLLLRGTGLNQNERNAILSSTQNSYELKFVARALRAQWGDQDLTKHDFASKGFQPVNAAEYYDDVPQSEPEASEEEEEVLDWDEDLRAAEEFLHEQEALAAQMQAGMDRKLVHARRAVADARVNRGFYQQRQSGARPAVGPPPARNQGGPLPRRLFGQPPSNVNKGCFICGDKNHLARDCPKRLQKGHAHFNDDEPKGVDDAESAGLVTTGPPEIIDFSFMCYESDDDSVISCYSDLEHSYTSLDLLGDGDFEAIESDVGSLLGDEDADATSEMETRAGSASLAKSTFDVENDLIILVSNVFNVSLEQAKVIVDSGAAETIGSPEAIDALIAKIGTFQPTAKVTTDLTVRPSFRFGNGSIGRAYSRVGVEVPWGTFHIFCVEAPGVPILLSIRALRELHANVDFAKNTLRYSVGADRFSTPLEQTEKGHLLLDIANPASVVVPCEDR